MQSSHQEVKATNNGDTPLHTLLCCDLHPASLKGFIEKTGKEEASKMAITLNDNKKLPIDIVMDANLNWHDKKQLISLLLPITLPEVKPLTEKLKFEEVRAKYQPAEGSQLEKNLRLAVMAVNYVRENIASSLTHPDMNKLDSTEATAILMETFNLREELNNERSAITENGKKFKFKTKNIHKHDNKIKVKKYISRDTCLDVTTIEACRGKAAHLGNCNEMSSMVIYFFMIFYFELVKDKYIDQFGIEGEDDSGDHEFCVIGRDSISDDYQDWSKDAVVIDPWMGSVFLASEIRSLLRDYHHLEIFDELAQTTEDYNILTYLNFKFHKLLPTFKSYSTNHFIEYDKDGYVYSYLNTLFLHLSARKMMDFYDHVKYNLELALNENLISKEELESLFNPIPALHSMFVNDFGLRGLRQGLFTLNDMNKVHKSLLKKLMSEEGLAFLATIKDLRNDKNEATAAWLYTLVSFAGFSMQSQQNISFFSGLSVNRGEKKDCTPNYLSYLP